jgi:hypothetical protein
MAKKGSNTLKREMEAFSKIVKQVELLDLRLARCESHLVALEGEPPEKLNQQINVTPFGDKENKTLQYAITFNLTGGTAQGEQEVPALFVQAMFVLKYSVESLDGLTKELIQQFGQLNGIFNAWPYWREFVQNLTCRMGLPGIRIPLLKKPFQFAPKDGNASQNQKKEADKQVASSSKGKVKKRKTLA